MQRKNPRPAETNAVCVECKKPSLSPANTMKRAKVCTPKSHACKSYIQESPTGKKRTFPCTEDCCRSRHRAGATSQFLSGVLDKDKWFENPAELIRVLKKVAEIKDPYRIGILLIAETGMRVGEALILKVSDFDHDTDPPHIMVATLTRKGHPHRRVDLRPVFAGLIAKYLAKREEGAKGTDPLIPCSKRSLQGWWTKCQADAGTRPLRGIHALRHTHFSRLAEIGVDPVYAQRRAGWASLSMYAVYAHISDRTRKGVAKKLPKL